MAVRTDIDVDFNVSPRIITLASPATTIDIQDLWDTLRTIEALLAHLGFDQLINRKSGGKLDLGGGSFSGIQLVLNNALFGFEARPGPTWAECQIAGGDILSVDAVNVLQWPINHTAYVTVGFRQSTSPALIGSADLALLRKIMGNEYYTDDDTGKIIVLDDDDVTVFKEADGFEDHNKTQQYRGQGIKRRTRFVDP